MVFLGLNFSEHIVTNYHHSSQYHAELLILSAVYQHEKVWSTGDIFDLILKSFVDSSNMLAVYTFFDGSHMT